MSNTAYILLLLLAEILFWFGVIVIGYMSKDTLRHLIGKNKE